MTDFTAWRPAKIPAGAFRLPGPSTTECGAEMHGSKKPSVMPRSLGRIRAGARVADALLRTRRSRSALPRRRPLLERLHDHRTGPVPGRPHASVYALAAPTATARRCAALSWGTLPEPCKTDTLAIAASAAIHADESKRRRPLEPQCSLEHRRQHVRASGGI